MNKNCPIIVAGIGFGVLFMGIICSWYAFPRLAEYAIGKVRVYKSFFSNVFYEIVLANCFSRW